MPIYAYRCDHCGARKDVLQKISDPALTLCSECGTEALRKELTAPAFQLKGTGWYVTDFRDNGKAPDKPAEGKPAAETAGSGSSDGGTASESASASKPAPAAAAPSTPAS
ncbi:MAG: FmdB family zinc ribbon protein [Burkholderiaceae bacterium]